MPFSWIILLFGGFVILGFGGTYYLIILKNCWVDKLLLSFACFFPTILAFVIIVLHFVASGKRLVITPVGISFLVFSYYLVRSIQGQINMTVGHRLLLVLMLLSCAWATWSMWMATHYCFMGACC